MLENPNKAHKNNTPPSLNPHSLALGHYTKTHQLASNSLKLTATYKQTHPLRLTYASKPTRTAALNQPSLSSPPADPDPSVPQTASRADGHRTAVGLEGLLNWPHAGEVTAAETSIPHLAARRGTSKPGMG